MIKKMQLDHVVATQMGMSPRKVAQITRCFLEQIEEQLSGFKAVELRNIGVLKPRQHKPRTIKISAGYLDEMSNSLKAGTQRGEVVKNFIVGLYMKPSSNFKERLLQAAKDRRNAMEKYGVDQQGLEKTASQQCPWCSSEIIKLNNVWQCPIHGTEPFEKAQEDGSEENKY